jgi:hypothetical protein
MRNFSEEEFGRIFCGARAAKNRAFRCNSASPPHTAGLWDFRFNPGCMGEQRFCKAKS